jgi:hypothetical protein
MARIGASGIIQWFHQYKQEEILLIGGFLMTLNHNIEKDTV